MKTKELTLISLAPNSYPDMIIKCRVVENIQEYVKALEKLQANKKESPQIAKKTANIIARIGIIGEVVDTRPRVERNGNIYVIGETNDTVKLKGSMIVTNPDGEQYIVKPDAFTKKYKETSIPGVFSSISEPIKCITLAEDIVFKAPWGKDMFGLKTGKLIINNMDDIYSITNVAFANTYTPLGNAFFIENCLGN